MSALRLATRGSRLALTQAEGVAAQLRAQGHEVELVTVDANPGGEPAPGPPTGEKSVPGASTGGETTPGRPAEDKSRFVRGVELALIEGRAEIGVHSAKDLPAEQPEELWIAAAPAREQSADVWIAAREQFADAGIAAEPGSEQSADAGIAATGDAATSGDAASTGDAAPRSGPGGPAAGVASAPRGAIVGTASVRRSSQLKALRPDLEVRELRGNVDTRLARVEAGDFDAIVLAEAGLNRLGRADAIGFRIPEAELVPAAGQGALLLQTRRDDDSSTAAAAQIGDAATLREVLAERELVRTLEADCDSPVGGRCRQRGDRLEIVTYVGSIDGEQWIRDSHSGAAANPEALGREAGERLRAAGAREILDGGG